jgi:hypothetical protein
VLLFWNFGVLCLRPFLENIVAQTNTLNIIQIKLY